MPEERLDTQVAGQQISLDQGNDEEEVVGVDGVDGEIAGGISTLHEFGGTLAIDLTAATEFSMKREKTFLDDLLQVFTHVASSQASWLSKSRDLYEKPLMQIRAIVISVALEFCFQGSLTLKDKPYKTWSTLRVALRELIVACLSSMRSACEAMPVGPDGGVEATALATSTCSTAVQKTITEKGAASASGIVQGWPDQIV